LSRRSPSKPAWNEGERASDVYYGKGLRERGSERYNRQIVRDGERKRDGEDE